MATSKAKVDWNSLTVRQAVASYMKGLQGYETHKAFGQKNAAVQQWLWNAPIMDVSLGALSSKDVEDWLQNYIASNPDHLVKDKKDNEIVTRTVAQAFNIFRQAILKVPNYRAPAINNSLARNTYQASPSIDYGSFEGGFGDIVGVAEAPEDKPTDAVSSAPLGDKPNGGKAKPANP